MQSDFRNAIDYPALLTQLRSVDATTRATAFYSLLWEQGTGPYNPGDRVLRLLKARPQLAPRIRAGLIRALEKENPTPDHPLQMLPKPYADYYGHLVWAVGALHDPAAVHALVGAVRSGVAEAGLISLGAVAEPPLRVSAKSKDVATRDAATRVLGRIAAERAHR
jgi:HEAT repeat protein